MIELRFLTRFKLGLPPEFNALSPEAIEKVLQYRASVVSPWMDVPEITEVAVDKRHYGTEK